MELILAIRDIASAIDQSVEAKSDINWKAAVTLAGMVSKGDTGQTSIDERFERAFGLATLRFQHRWWDTSKTFSPGPDRTRLILTLLHGDGVLSEYNGTYDT
ncbi:hypothetical protein ELH42_37750 [Rhizobium ruizarguesonis]|uniref:hypothetical protein n=1 Tax=Rhizobium ruizarguesonis TaxID=2081791 RepID=UPI00102F80E6|nr:hypothetical protein [Rhizobium ruizarguesonis]TBB57024.1 hypothetical protein ELH42_37750 [Rhizobium ruizarguesonis]